MDAGQGDVWPSRAASAQGLQERGALRLLSSADGQAGVVPTGSTAFLLQLMLLAASSSWPP